MANLTRSGTLWGSMPSAAEELRRLFGQQRRIENKALAQTEREEAALSAKTKFAQEKGLFYAKKIEILNSVGVLEELRKLGAVIEGFGGVSVNIREPKNPDKVELYVDEDGRLGGVWEKHDAKPIAELNWVRPRKQVNPDEEKYEDVDLRCRVTVGVALEGEILPWSSLPNRPMSGSKRKLGGLISNDVLKTDCIFVIGNESFPIEVGDNRHEIQLKEELSRVLVQAVQDPQKYLAI